MSQQDKQKKFFWRIHSNFFHEAEIDLMECESKIGKDIVLIYLKLMCEACVNNGELTYNDGKPYTMAQLKHRTGGYQSFNKAWKYLVDNHFAEVWDDGTIYLPYAHKQSGKETGQTKRNRESGVENFNQGSQENQPELNKNSTITTTITKDISINKDIDYTTTDSSGSSYTKIRESLSEQDMQHIRSYYDLADELIDRVDKEVQENKRIVNHPLSYIMTYARNNNWYRRAAYE